VTAHNPDNFFTPWSSHPFLEDVRVEYRQVGDAIWKRARTTEGTFDNLKDKANSEGFAETFVDVSKWEDSEYELRLFSFCGNQPGATGFYASKAIAGHVDRVEPRIFGGFAEPADGIWTPGDMIAVRMTEEVDCRTPYTFNAHVVIKGDESQIVVDNDQLDLKCDGDTIEVAFSMYSLLYSIPDLLGKEITVFVENSRDKAGNFQEVSVKWSFKVGDFDLNNTAVLLTLYFEELSISDYTKDSDSFNEQVVSEACALASCEEGQEPIVADVREGSIWLDLQWPQDTGSYSSVERFFQNLENSTSSGDMLLSGAELKSLSYKEAVLPQVEDPNNQAAGIEDVDVEYIRPPVGAIVGAVVGGTLFLALVFVAIWILWGKKNAQTHTKDDESSISSSSDSVASDVKIATITNITEI